MTTTERQTTVRFGTFLHGVQVAGADHAAALRGLVEAPLASEAAGFDEVWLAKHHFIPPCVCPQAATLAEHLLHFPEGAGSREATLETFAGLADAVPLMT